MHWASPDSHKGRISDGSSHQELEEGPGPPEIASLARAKLHQSGEAMLGELTELAVGGKRLTLPKGSDLL